MSDVDKRLKAALQKKDRLAADLNRCRGRLEAARQSLAEVNQQCLEKKVDPEKLEELIQKLEDKYQQRVETLEENLRAVEVSLAPYIKGETV